MGFGKYTKDERKIVEKINKLLQRRVWYRQMTLKINLKIQSLIDQLGGKYQRKT